MPLSSLHKGTIVSVPSPLLSEVLRVTCLRVVLGRYQRRSLTFFAFVQAYVAEVIRYTDDLPPHVKGTAYWLNHETHPSGYYYAEPNQEPVPVEFINDAWYILHFVHAERTFGTRASY